MINKEVKDEGAFIVESSVVNGIEVVDITATKLTKDRCRALIAMLSGHFNLGITYKKDGITYEQFRKEIELERSKGKVSIPNNGIGVFNKYIPEPHSEGVHIPPLPTRSFLEDPYSEDKCAENPNGAKDELG